MSRSLPPRHAPPPPRPSVARRVAGTSLAAEEDLAAVIDHLLDRGVLLRGEVVLAVGGVDLVYLGLDVLLASVGTLAARHRRRTAKRELAAGSSPRPSARRRRKQ